jgi:hypothetical protein
VLLALLHLRKGTCKEGGSGGQSRVD